MSNWWLSVCLLSVVFGVQPVFADTPKPSLVVLQLPGLTDEKGQGAYANFYEALQREGLISGWRFYSPLRAHHAFLKDENSCIAPASVDLLKKYERPLDDYLVSSPFNKVLGVVMSAANPPTRGGEKPVMGTVGFGVQHGVKAGTYRIEGIANYTKLLRLISEDRLDAAYIVYPDVVHHVGAQQAIAAFTGKIEVRWVGTDGVLCWRRQADNLAKISEAIDLWRRNGELKAMFGKYFVK